MSSVKKVLKTGVKSVIESLLSHHKEKGLSEEEVYAYVGSLGYTPKQASCILNTRRAYNPKTGLGPTIWKHPETQRFFLYADRVEAIKKEAEMIVVACSDEQLKAQPELWPLIEQVQFKTKEFLGGIIPVKAPKARKIKNVKRRNSKAVTKNVVNKKRGLLAFTKKLLSGHCVNGLPLANIKEAAIKEGYTIDQLRIIEPLSRGIRPIFQRSPTTGRFFNYEEYVQPNRN